MKDINNIIFNPVRMRIIQRLSTEKSITTNDLCKFMNDVPRTTIYRHVKILLNNDILSVVSEKKVRGSVERTIALNINAIRDLNTAENAVKNAFGFLMSIYEKFKNYFSAHKENMSKQKLFLSNIVLMMSDEEFDSFLAEMTALSKKYNFKISENRKPRDISIISSPVDEA
ncbi:helix-turn-helix domain-containing protein [Sedimentibacter sp. zth1]|uniref:helix-turn-helix domain-containing protein n=1 Tax=Sedimentibacter sp. zth1 TaxID=2816908 RepID=UPI001A936AA5|nr:helix-turn-helix domain-containing protein [Sedimentibacter sp. zth1]QSX06280.1 helix-turn-helix domain-containing protein [Sedimentibacter sp. zth1]